jgi:hypothetical protein
VVIIKSFATNRNSTEYKGQLFDTCTIIWKNIHNKPFTRFQAFKIMVAILKKYPDFSNEKMENVRKEA